MVEVARAPNQTRGSHILAYSASRAPDNDSALIGTAEEICDKLAALHAAGAEYLIVNVVGLSRTTLRRFAEEIAPGFAAEPAPATRTDALSAT